MSESTTAFFATLNACCEQGKPIALALKKAINAKVERLANG